MCIIDALARRANAQQAYWLEDADGEWIGSVDYCRTCAEKKAGKEHQVCGPLSSEDSDGCRHCDECGVLLHYVLTEYGVRSEMEHFIENGVSYPLTPEDAYHLQAIEDQLPYSKVSWTN